MRKGGKVKSGAAKSGPKNIKGKAIPKKKGGLAIMIAVGKPKKGK